jgi:sulfatase modifying factor 1
VGNLSTVSAFRMSAKEITAAQFTAVTGLANPSHFPGVTNGPVEQVNWYNALVFCNKLSILEGKTPVYTISSSTDPAAWGAVPTSSNATWDAAIANWGASGYRLPTEMEWMWAAMGADTANPGVTNFTGLSKEFSGITGEIGDNAWYSVNSGSTTHTAGTKNANELGIYDMSGNVLEWVWDWYSDPYPNGLVTNYWGAASGAYRVARGGSWDRVASYAVIASRDGDVPAMQGSNFGFRVVRP